MHMQNVGFILNKVAEQNFNNTSKYDFEKLLADSNNIENNFSI